MGGFRLSVDKLWVGLGLTDCGWMAVGGFKVDRLWEGLDKVVSGFRVDRLWVGPGLTGCGWV